MVITFNIVSNLFGRMISGHYLPVGSEEACIGVYYKGSGKNIKEDVIVSRVPKMRALRLIILLLIE